MQEIQVAFFFSCIFINQLSEGCWDESESECEAEKDPTFKNYNYEGNILEKYGKLDVDSILPHTYAKVNPPLTHQF